MLKKLFLISLFPLLLLSCTKVAIVSDPYWEILVEEFQNRAAGLKINALLNGKFLIKNVLEGSSQGFKPADHLNYEADVYLFSPLLSKTIISTDILNRESVYYLFENSSLLKTANNYSVFAINYDRTSSFAEAGRIISGNPDINRGVSIIFDKTDLKIKSEAKSFLSALGNNGDNPMIARFEIDLSTSENDIEDFFNTKIVSESVYIIIFTDKWKKICYDLSVRDNKKIVTSDFWYTGSYGSSVVLSVENDMKGLMEKVYKNIKLGNHRDISLNGILR